MSKIIIGDKPFGIVKDVHKDGTVTVEAPLDKIADFYKRCPEKFKNIDPEMRKILEAINNEENTP